MTSIAQEKKKIIKENEDKISLEIFRNWIESYGIKTYNLNDSKENISIDFYNDIIRNKFKDSKELAISIMKSYFMKDEKEAVSFANLADLKISKPFGLISKFLNDYVVEGKTVECKNQTQAYQVVADIIVDKTEDIFGDYAYLNALNPYSKLNDELKRNMVFDCVKKGYKFFGKDVGFLFRNETSKPEIKESYQLYLLETYEKLVNNYVVDYAAKINKNMTAEQFNEYWKIVENCLNNIESRISDENKKNLAFAKSKEIVTKFDNDAKEKIRLNCTNAGKKGDRYPVIKEALVKFEKGVQTEDDVEVLKEFYEELKRINTGLSVKDENGKMYPTNYFACTDLKPLDTITLITKIQKCGMLTKEQLDYVQETKSLIRFAFSNDTIAHTFEVKDAEKTLSSFRGVTHNANGQVVDLSTQEAYSIFARRVENYIEENDLPNNELCAKTIAREFVVGRTPVTMNTNSENKDLISK